MIVDAISDLHGYYPKLEGGDLLIVAGDLTATHTYKEAKLFCNWFLQQPYEKKIVIGGNHDGFLEKEPFIFEPHFPDCVYLCDSGCEFEGLKIWGSPWTKSFPKMNPECKAFTFDTEDELAEKWKLIPKDIDILITHSPPLNLLDSTRGLFPRNLGSSSLEKIISEMNHKLHVFGHIHESYGFREFQRKDNIKFNACNASHVNKKYKPVNKPIRIVL